MCACAQELYDRFWSLFRKTQNMFNRGRDAADSDLKYFDNGVLT